jgi:predicted GNAT family N-acyltransferase
MSALTFRWARLHDLTAPEWHSALAAREAVFIVEQNCPYQDADALDVHSWHLLGSMDGTLAAYLRVVDPGRKSVPLASKFCSIAAATIRLTPMPSASPSTAYLR